MRVMNPKRKKNQVTELKDLDVQRVDGVDKPATGRRFLLFKSAAERVGTVAKDIARRSGVSFSNIVLGTAPVAKMHPPSDECDEYNIEDMEPNETRQADTSDMDAEDSRMARTLAGWSGQAGETKHVNVPGDHEYARDSFLYPTGEFGQPPVQPYVNRGSSTSRPTSPNFISSMGHPDGLVMPENFDPPEPGSVKAGDGTVRKRRGGFWGDLVTDQPSPAELEYLAHQAGDTEALAAIAKAKRAQGATEGFRKARRGGSRWI